MRPSVPALAILILLLAGPLQASPRLQVVATLPSYASIAGFVGGERVEVRSISRPEEDSHFVKPKPSLALMLKSANLFITTGLDLELWAPTLVDKSGNRAIRDGALGYATASQGVEMLDVPASASRAAGDVHIFGNPHIHTSPINAKSIAGNIAQALIRVDPKGEETYRANLEAFRRRIDASLYGDELPNLIGADVLDRLAAQGKLIPFLEQKSYEGKPLLDRLGGWLRQGMAFRGKQIIAYHKNWIYFTTLFGLDVVDYVERKPGIPPSARHVHDLIGQIEQGGIHILLSANYFSPAKPQAIADRTGCTVVRVPLEPDLDNGEDYFTLMNLWVGRLAAAFTAGS
ncbi:MAG: metal ABC transporter substrate-binding protein [Acidobacteriota bacterium]